MATTSDYQEHVYDLEKEVEDLKSAAVRDETVISGLLVELEFVRGQQTQTLARKSNVMQDWLVDQTTKHKLRCQIRALRGQIEEAGHEPIE